MGLTARAIPASACVENVALPQQMPTAGTPSVPLPQRVMTSGWAPIPTPSTWVTLLHALLGALVCNAAPMEIPARFLIDAATLRFSTGETLAAAAAHHDNSASTGGTTLGRGCFGFVRSMTCNGAPVAVKELSGGSLDDTSIGEVFLNRRFLRAPACTRRGGSLDRHRPAPSPFCRFYSPVLAVLLQTMSWRS